MLVLWRDPETLYYNKLKWKPTVEVFNRKTFHTIPLQERLTPSIYTQNLQQYPISGGCPIELSNSCSREKLIMSRNPLRGNTYCNFTQHILSSLFRRHLRCPAGIGPISEGQFTQEENRYLPLWLPIEKTFRRFSCHCLVIQGLWSVFHTIQNMFLSRSSINNTLISRLLGEWKPISVTLCT